MRILLWPFEDIPLDYTVCAQNIIRYDARCILNLSWFLLQCCSYWHCDRFCMQYWFLISFIIVPISSSERFSHDFFLFSILLTNWTTWLVSYSHFKVNYKKTKFQLLLSPEINIIFKYTEPLECNLRQVNVSVHLLGVVLFGIPSDLRNHRLR